jgi:hypothetical protein
MVVLFQNVFEVQKHTNVERLHVALPLASANVMPSDHAEQTISPLIVERVQIQLEFLQTRRQMVHQM